MRNKIIGWFVIVILLVPTYRLSAEAFRKVGTSSATFLRVGVGARALAMGGAFEALASDATTVYWNPAGMANSSGISWVFDHADWFVDTSHDFSALMIPINRGSYLGFSINMMRVGEEEITTEADPKGNGQYWDATDLCLGISYARRMTNQFSLGMTVKYISERIWNETASAVAMDVGTYLNTGYKGIVIGMSFTNFGNNMQLAGRDLIREYDPNAANTLNANVDTRLHTEPWALPVCFKISTAIDLMGSGDRYLVSDNSRLTLAVNGVHPNDDSEKLNIGMEYAWRELVFLRGGYNSGYDLPEFSWGGGLKLDLYGRTFSLDYAFLPYGDLKNVQHFTISSNF
ncbi:MAG: PorV/PorQ family protein [Candidatus Neomarinimicrobiota bacterium]